MTYKQEQKEIKQLAHDILKKMIEMCNTHGCVGLEDFIGEITPIIPGRNHSHTGPLPDGVNQELHLYRQLFAGLEHMDETTPPEKLSMTDSYEKYLRRDSK